MFDVYRNQPHGDDSQPTSVYRLRLDPDLQLGCSKLKLTPLFMFQLPRPDVFFPFPRLAEPYGFQSSSVSITHAFRNTTSMEEDIQCFGACALFVDPKESVQKSPKAHLNTKGLIDADDDSSMLQAIVHLTTLSDYASHLHLCSASGRAIYFGCNSRRLLGVHMVDYLF